MKILISNDDGIHAKGIYALAVEVAKEHTAVIAAPNIERSGAGHSLTYMIPLFAEEISIKGLEGVKAFSVSGTPVDCVKLGVSNLVNDVDLVVSGINNGPNLGTDVLYSGTVSAAMEAAICGYPAIAVSLCSFRPKFFETAALVARNAIRYVEDHPIKRGVVYNINVPDLPYEELKGVKVASLAHHKYEKSYDVRQDPYGRQYYWTLGKAKDKNLSHDSDVYFIQEGYVTITPLNIDIADQPERNKMEKADFSLCLDRRC